MKNPSVWLIWLVMLSFLGGSYWGTPTLAVTSNVSGGFAIVSPEFSFSDKQKSMEIEYWLNNYQPKEGDDTLYLDVWRLNTAVFPLPDWIDKTYYLPSKRFDELFDKEFNTMFAETETQTKQLLLPKESGQKLKIKIDVDPYYDYLVSMTFVRNDQNNFTTDFKLVGGNYLELTPRPDIRCEMETITKNGATICCMPQMFYASKKDNAKISLEISDLQADKLVPTVVYKKTATIVAIADPDKAPPWNKPDYVTFQVSGLKPDHSYMAKITSLLPHRTATVQKMFTTLK